MKKIILLSFFIARVYCLTFSQNVGVGTITPLAKLHIKGTADTTQLLIDGNSIQTNSRPLIKLRNSSGVELLRIHSDDTSNLFIGSNAGLGNNVTIANGGFNNTFIGTDVGRLNTTGNNNTAIGSQSLSFNSIGSDNTANGALTLYSNTTGSRNTANGAGTLYSNTTGNNNTAIGCQTLYYNTIGSFNTANGFQSLYSNTSGSYNTATGYQSLLYNSTGSYNTANGFASLYSNTIGGFNTANGSWSLFYNGTGSYNTANGFEALYANTSGSYNTANGVDALYSNNIGSYNTANGYQSLFRNTTGDNNAATGYLSLYSNTTGMENTADGSFALFGNVTGSFNTAFGFAALYNTLSSNENSAFGYRAGSNYNLGYNNTFVGSYADANASGIFNSVAIGKGSLASGSNQVRIGNSAISVIEAYANWTNISDGRVKKNITTDIPGLSFINKLTPVTYNLDLDAVDKIMQPSPKLDKAGKMIPVPQFETDARKQKELIVYSGFIAQDVEQAAKALGYEFSGIDAANNDKDLYGLRYAEFVVPLVKAAQELSQRNVKYAEEAARRQQFIETLKKEMAAQENLSKLLQIQIDELKVSLKK